MASSCSSRTRRRPECEFSSSRLQRGEGRSCVAQVSAACGPLPLPAAGRGRHAQSCACRVRGSLRECVAQTRADQSRATAAPQLHACRTAAVEQAASAPTGWFQVCETGADRRVDFICRDRRVIVEVDGGQHATRAISYAIDGCEITITGSCDSGTTMCLRRWKGFSKHS